MFLRVFGQPERSDDRPDVEMLDLDTLRARIGADAAAPAEGRRDAVIVRFDGRTSSPRRSWRDAMRPSR